MNNNGTLNTIVDNTGIVTSLVANQFTLPIGTYQIESFVPSVYSGGHKARLRNITSNTTSLIGTSSFSATGGGAILATTTSTEVVTQEMLDMVLDELADA